MTIDVEALPFRAADTHVDRLIWGRFPEGEFGIGKMMDIADQYRVPLTMFTDLSEIDCYGEAIRQVGWKIVERGHDFQLHVHPENFAASVWGNVGGPPTAASAQTLNCLTEVHARIIAQELVRRYRSIAAKQPLAFRGGGYCFNEELVCALANEGVIINSSVNRSRKTQPFLTAACKQFLWPNGSLEIPVAAVDSFRNIPRPFDFNFNSAHFPDAERMLEYIEHFSLQFGQEAIVVLVMHSWSLLDISRQHFGPPIPDNVKRLDQFLRLANQHHDFVSAPMLYELAQSGVLDLDATIDPRGRGELFWCKGARGFAHRNQMRLASNYASKDKPGSKSRRADIVRGSFSTLEEFGYPWHTSPQFKPTMEAMLAGCWEKAGEFVTDMRPPINFDDQPRPHACDLHSWEPVGYALRAAEVFNDRRYFELACGVIFDWLDRYWQPVSAQTDEAHLDRLIADDSTFAWYDMAVGRRIFRLAYVLEVLARTPDSDESQLERLWQALQFHHAILSREHFFRANSNHGFFQALGQYAAAKRFFHMPESAQQFALARERLLRLLDAHFSDEGVHLEHSPGYHYGLMTALIGGRASGVLTEIEISQRIDAIEEVLAWMIAPDGKIVAIGDTDPKPMARSDQFVGQFENAGLKYQMSAGRLGRKPTIGVRAYLSAGYAFARLHSTGTSLQPETFSYLAQHAGYHSRVHKHADHLSFVWYDKGQDVVVDPGRFAYLGRTDRDSDLYRNGFWYSDPRRIYVESTRAHNCVEIDKQSYPRAGPSSRPFGSALRYAGEQGGVVVTECEANHFRSIRHWRALVMKPGRFLLALDWLYDRTPGALHDFRQWFQLHPDWQVQSSNGVVRARSFGGQAAPAEALTVASLLPEPRLAGVYRGQDDPEMQGWISDKANSLVPAASICFERAQTDMAHFATLFVLDDRLEVDVSLTRVNRSMRTARFEWTDSHGRSEVRLQRTEGNPIQVWVKGARRAETD